MISSPTAFVIAGAGVAGLEAALSLRELLGRDAPITLVGASDTFHYKPLGVGEPFGLGRPHHHPIAPIAADLGLTFVRESLESVAPQSREIVLASGERLSYERLLVAVGAPTRRPSPFGVLFDREHDAEAFDEVLADLRAGLISHVAFAVPAGVTWPLPAYELALMTAAWGSAAQPGGVQVSIVSHEATPLALFGPEPSRAVSGVLERAGVAFHGAVEPVLESDVLIRRGNHLLQTERIVVLPEHTGPRVSGLPVDDHGFVPVDPWGRVPGADAVYAIGDAGDHPVKHGGLAAQQAAIAAQAIAFDAGHRDRLDDPRAILRGLLRTIDGPLYLRAAIDDPVSGTVSREPLWWPPSKIAAPRLTSYLGRIERARAEGRILPTGGGGFTPATA